MDQYLKLRVIVSILKAIVNNDFDSISIDFCFKNIRYYLSEYVSLENIVEAIDYMNDEYNYVLLEIDHPVGEKYNTIEDVKDSWIISYGAGYNDLKQMIFNYLEQINQIDIDGWVNVYFPVEYEQILSEAYNEIEDNTAVEAMPSQNELESDTFYALGGHDYQEWKKKGGNLDDMMDALGL